MLQWIKDKYYKVIRYFHNLKKFHSILVDDRDYDFMWLIKLIRHKLVCMEHFFLTDAIVEGAEEDAKNMRRCIKVLDRLIEDDYCKEEFEDIEERFGKLRYTKEMGFCGSKVKTKEDYCKEGKDIISLLHKEERLKEYDMHLFCEIFKKHYRNWWD